MGPRELVAAGREAGFRRWMPGLTGSTAVWESANWRVECTPMLGHVEVKVLERDRAVRWDGWIDTFKFWPTEASRVAEVFAILGVLRGIEAAA